MLYKIKTRRLNQSLLQISALRAGWLLTQPFWKSRVYRYNSQDEDLTVATMADVKEIGQLPLDSFPRLVVLRGDIDACPDDLFIVN